MRDTFARRFQELDEAGRALPFHAPESRLMPANAYVLNGAWRGWATSVLNLLGAVYGNANPHYHHFMSAYEVCKGEDHTVKAMFYLLRSAREDFEGGYVFNIELRVSGEVFGDFVALAWHSLREGQKDVAAVLACAALEDALKRYAVLNNISVDGKAMSDVVNALKGASLVAGAQKTLLDAMPRVRNMAMHGEWSKITEPDVASVLGFVEQFLLSKFSE